MWRRKKKEEETVVLNAGQKYLEAIPLRDGRNIQIIPCGWTDMEKLWLQVSIRHNAEGTMNYFISPYINTVEAEA